jgi:hypothetical protein
LEVTVKEDKAFRKKDVGSTVIEFKNLKSGSQQAWYAAGDIEVQVKQTVLQVRDSTLCLLLRARS